MTAREAAVFILRKKYPNQDVDVFSDEFRTLAKELESYDSADDTAKHQNRVAEFMYKIIHELEWRVNYHDRSKLSPEEKPYFDKATLLLAYLTYGTEEYREALRMIKPALDHHYSVNRHHPEHFSDGMSGMNLVDIIEMFCDWAAASERHEDGNLRESIYHNRERFRYDGVMEAIFENTCMLIGK
jgi:hypothetical protein